MGGRRSLKEWNHRINSQSDKIEITGTHRKKKEIYWESTLIPFLVKNKTKGKEILTTTPSSLSNLFGSRILDTAVKGRIWEAAADVPLSLTGGWKELLFVVGKKEEEVYREEQVE